MSGKDDYQRGFEDGARSAARRVFMRLDDLAHNPDATIAAVTRLILEEHLENHEALAAWAIHQDSPAGKAERENAVGAG